MIRRRYTMLLILLFWGFAVVVVAGPHYYPADIGNIWVLDITDGTERMTYRIESTEEEMVGESLRLLRITTEALGTSSATTSALLVEVNAGGLLLHRLVAELGDIFGVARIDFSPPAIFFPSTLALGAAWAADGETTVFLAGAATVSSENEVVAVESVVTPVGTFSGCLKIETRTRVTTTTGVSRSSAYLWLAPDLGPVKFETDQDIVFVLISSNLLPVENRYDVTGDGVVNILDLTFVAFRFGGNDPEADINADGTVNVLDLTLIAQNFGA